MVLVRGPQPFDDVVNQLELLRNEAANASSRLRGQYAELPRIDPRVMVARHLKAVISTTFLAALHLSTNLLRPAWWGETFGASLDRDAVQDELDDYVVMLPNMLTFYTFSLFEAGLRRVARVLSPATAALAEKPAKRLLAGMVADLRNHGVDLGADTSAFLDLFREVRNCVHNNATYYSLLGMDLSITWRGDEYVFHHGEQVDFIDWDFDFRLARELIAVNELVMASPPVRRLPPIA